MSPEKYEVGGEHLDAGFAKAKPGKAFDVAPFVPIRMGDDLAKCREAVKRNLALYIGGMGARGKNFYNDYATPLGSGDAAKTLQALFLGGRKDDAVTEIGTATLRRGVRQEG